MTTHEAFAAAFTEVAALSIVRNKQLGNDKREQLIRQDAQAILERLQASIETAETQSFAIAAMGGFEQEDYLREQPE